MTGFWRPNRSYYLDCMDVKVGDIVICKCNCGLSPFTPGNSYIVKQSKMLTDDNGVDVLPSARFMYQ